MLVGGLIGPVVGVMLESEPLTVAGYIFGAIVGAVGGSILGFRWQSRRQKDHPPSNATD